jgi:hypothetical protein
LFSYQLPPIKTNLTKQEVVSSEITPEKATTTADDSGIINDTSISPNILSQFNSSSYSSSHNQSVGANDSLLSKTSAPTPPPNYTPYINYQQQQQQVYSNQYQQQQQQPKEVIKEEETETSDEKENDSPISNDENSQTDQATETVDNSNNESSNNSKTKKSKSPRDQEYDINDPTKPPKPYLEIIADAVLSCSIKMMQLHEIYGYMEEKYAYFQRNVNKSWRNSVRHNLSLNECFIKAGRGSNGKGNYWRIHPLCEKEFIRGNFRRKSFKQLIRAGNQQSTSPSIYPPNQAATQQQNFNSYNYSFNYSNNPSQFVINSSKAAALDSFQYPPFFTNQFHPVHQVDNEKSHPKVTEQQQQRLGNQRFRPY